MTTKESRWRNDQSSVSNKNKNNPKVKIGAVEVKTIVRPAWPRLM